MKQAFVSTRLSAVLWAVAAAMPALTTQQLDAQPLPTRQVHLDFHTSEHIPGIGERFDRAQFQAALRAGEVNQINLFAKCHHSWSYYPTSVGTMHPHLDFDLLGAQIEACHEIGVVCPIYFTVGWSATDAERHPEWCARDREGTVQASGYWKPDAKPTDPKPNGTWKWLCPAIGGPYHAHIVEQVEEICRRYPIDGLWFDIYEPANRGCYCDACRVRMRTEGVDPADAAAVVRSTALAIKAHMHDLRERIARHHPRATVFFNQTPHVRDRAMFTERLFDENTHQEIEDLPTTWGGYDKLPVEAKYHLSQGSRIVAMSGKFHKSWGEFGGFKHADAIRYEAALMIANGAACNFGDQLHPSGEMDIETYRNIGHAYRYVKSIEDYGPGGVPYSRLGVWLSLDHDADHGLVNMLLEMHRDFVVVDRTRLAGLSTLLLPSRPCLSPADTAAIAEWVAGGGRLIVFGAGALDPQRTRFVLDVGAEYLGGAQYAFDYTVVKEAIGAGVVTTPFLNYQAGLRARPTAARVLAMIREPYFDRTYAQYSSHANTPYRLEDSPYPAVLRHGDTIFFAHPLDRLYYTHAVRIHRELVRNALELLEADPVLAVRGLPSSGRVSMLHQQQQRRYVAHLLYSPALQRGEVKVIEDFPAIADVTIEVRVPERVTRVRTIPAGGTPAFTRDGDTLRITVPTFTMHTGIVLEY